MVTRKEIRICQKSKTFPQVPQTYVDVELGNKSSVDVSERQISGTERTYPLDIVTFALEDGMNFNSWVNYFEVGVRMRKEMMSGKFVIYTDI